MMKLIKPWVENLGINPKEFSSWSEQTPRSESVTFWCLVNGKLNEDQYLNWARDHYELLSINAEFFKIPPNFTLWNKIKTVANWSKELVPICEWDGTVFVACVEPLLDVKWSFPVQYVLASASDLQSHWELLNSSSATQDEKSFASFPPPPDQQLAEIPPEPMLDVKAQTSDAPEGLASMPSITPTFDAPTFDAPEGIVISTPHSNTESDGPQGFSYSEASIAPLQEAPEGLSVLTSTHVDVSEKEIAPPIISLSEFQQKAVVKPKTDTTTTHPVSATNTQHLIGFLQNIRKDFNGGLILKVTQGSIKAEVWDEPFKSKDGAAMWSLSEPSAFRIAYRTRMPYLGHIVDTKVNSEFFKYWGFNELPKNALVQPVSHEGEITHLILAICRETQKNHHVLQLGEQLVSSFHQVRQAA